MPSTATRNQLIRWPSLLVILLKFSVSESFQPIYDVLKRSSDGICMPRSSSILRAASQPFDEVSRRDNDNNQAQDSSIVLRSSDMMMLKHEEKGFRETLLRLAKLSLEDYEWRSSIFKSNEADRMVEETIARMQGKEPNYLRPMDATEEKIGPLGKWEKSAVGWLAQVIDEEGRRAKQIIALQGKLIRPIEADELGPLGMLERNFVDFLRSIRSSESERVRTRTLRPMDLEESIRGPLGQMENAVSGFFQEIRESEKLRAQLGKNNMIRPIDVPGPLGELELWIGEVLKAEELRSAQRNGGKIVRPKDAKIRGPLGEVEQKAFDFLDQLSAEERDRLRSISQYLKDSRPMESNQDSFLGLLETVAVGIIRAPLLVFGVINRVRELMYSEPLSEEDQQIVNKRRSGDDYETKDKRP